jgi:KipI family sensor histidine kinase inhibitor
MPERLSLRCVGVDAVMLYLEEDPGPDTAAFLRAAELAVEATLGPALVDLVPSYASLLIVYDPLQTGHIDIMRSVRVALRDLSTPAAAQDRLVTLPVYYAPEAGPDLEALARDTGLGIDQVVALHSGAEYRVYAIGFAPGFAYLGEVDERIAAPRRATPRARVPAGSVAIADRQTAVYPADSPGGWNLIGLCPIPLFTPESEPPMPVRVGDRVRFEPIDRADFLALEGQIP